MNVIGADCHATLTRLVLGTQRSRWVCRRALRQCSSSRRSIHTVHSRRELLYPIEDGVGDFLPPNALRTVVEWQDGLLERLNDQVRGTNLAKPKILQIVIESASDQANIRAHNYACLAANNSFFLDGLKPPKNKSDKNEVAINHDLRHMLSASFKDLDGLKERFVASASGMVSSGWLWLVMDNYGRLAVVPTFGAGTLLARSRKCWNYHEQITLARQPWDWLAEPLENSIPSEGVSKAVRDGPSSSSPASGTKSTPPNLNPRTPTRSLSSSLTTAMAVSRSNPSVRDEDTTRLGNNEAQRRMAQQIGSTLYPLCCLSLFEHTWMSAGLGVWGKEEYVRRYFDVLDWEKVYKIFSKFRDSKESGAQVV